MTGSETFGEEDRAKDYELGILYALTEAWLEANMPLYVEQVDEITGIFDGLPIAEHDLRYEFEIPGNILKSVLPIASDYFGDDDTLSLMYHIPHYSAIPKNEDEDDEEEVGYRYYKPKCNFDIEMASEPKYGVSITIEDVHAEDDNEDTWRVKRILHTDLEVGNEIIENPAGLPFVDAEQLENVTSVSKLTREEYGLFSAIVGKLDELKAMMPDPPLYLPEDPR